MSVYVEYPSDASFTAFLAQLTPSRVLKDLSSGFSKPERKRRIFLREKNAYEVMDAYQLEVATAKAMAAVMVGRPSCVVLEQTKEQK